jgi:hypothetical protein
MLRPALCMLFPRISCDLHVTPPQTCLPPINLANHAVDFCGSLYTQHAKLHAYNRIMSALGHAISWEWHDRVLCFVAVVDVGYVCMYVYMYVWYIN